MCYRVTPRYLATPPLGGLRGGPYLQTGPKLRLSARTTHFPFTVISGSIGCVCFPGCVSDAWRRATLRRMGRQAKEV